MKYNDEDRAHIYFVLPVGISVGQVGTNDLQVLNGQRVHGVLASRYSRTSILAVMLTMKEL